MSSARTLASLRTPVSAWLAAILLVPILAVCGAEPAEETGLETWEFEPAERIGSIDGSLTFSNVLDVSVGPDDRLYVTQWRTPYVIALERSDGPVRADTIGRGGDGPGEFTHPGSLDWMGDTLWVGDGSSESQAYRLDGSHVRDVSFLRSAGDGFLGYGPGRPVRPGARVTHPGYGMGRASQGRIPPVPYFAVDEDGAVRDTLVTFDLAGQHAFVSLSSGGGIITNHPLPPVPRPEVGAGGVTVIERPEPADRPTFRVVRLSWEGDTVFSSEIPYEPISVTDEWRATTFDELVALMLRPGQGRADLRAALEEGMPLPAHLPPVSGVLVGPSGRSWLRREDVRWGPVRWQVLDVDGRLEAELNLPPGADVHHASDFGIWAVVKDELDVEYLQRYGVVSAHSGTIR